MNAEGARFVPPGRAYAAPRGGERQRPVRVMIVDDSLTVRTIFKRMVESDPSMCVIGTASSGERAIAQIGREHPDVLLLDLEMPGMGGLQALPVILASAPETQVLVVSSLTEDGAEATVAALSTGAADTMLKPRPGGFDETYRSQLLAKIRAVGLPAQTADRCNDVSGSGSGTEANDWARRSRKRAAACPPAQPEIVAIGASTGGIHAINILLHSLRPDFDLPIVITQHLPASFIPVFARQIELASGRRTSIAEDGTPVRKGEICVATGHAHMTLRRSGQGLVARASTHPARSGCLPSVDPMLESLAETCKDRGFAVILSGMGRDGVEGAERLHEAGGTIWAQDADSSAVWGMPGAVSRAGIASFIGSPEAIGEAIATRIGERTGDRVNLAAVSQLA